MVNRTRVAAVAIGIALAMVCVGAVRAAALRAGTLELDPSKTLIEFSLRGSLHTTHGQFRLKRGRISADQRTGNAEGEIIVDAASGESGDPLRDDRMRDAVLETASWPEITFKPRRIVGNLDSNGNFRANLEGLLLLHGSKHDVVIEAQGQMTERQLIATAHFSIPYVEWGLKDPSILFLAVANRVDIKIATAGSITWQP
jgi:polyisoprenoid-binding protein YceI